MNLDIIQKIQELSYTFMKHGLNAEMELTVDTHTYYMLQAAYGRMMPRDYTKDYELPVVFPKEFNAFVIDAPGGKITVVPKRSQFKEFSDDDQYPF